MAIYLYIIGFLVIVALLVQQSVANEIAVKKGYESQANHLIGLIPVYGVIHFLKKKNLKDTTESSIRYAWNPQVLFRSFLIFSLLTVIAIIIIVPVSILGYLSIKNDLLKALLFIYFTLFVIFSYHSLVVEVARKKGYEDIFVHLITLVPLFGLFHILVQLSNEQRGEMIGYKRNTNQLDSSKALIIYALTLLPIFGLIYYVWLVPKKRNISNSAIRQSFSVGSILSRLLVYGEITLVSVIVIVPVVYIFGLAFSNIQTNIPNTIWPTNPNLGAFTYLFEETKFFRWYGNTLVIAMINMLVGTILITGAAYVFARFQFKGKKAGLLSILVLQAFPSFMGLIAMYVLFWKFNLLGKPAALSILYIGGSIPGNLWLIKGFLSQIPKDLDESAMIDGANKVQIFTQIILPLSVPILTFVAVSMFMGPWMDYMLPGFLLNYYPRNAGVGYDVTNQWTLAVGLFKFITDQNYMHYSAFAAGALLVGLPITVLYMVFQKYLIEGIMAGATKG